MGRGVAGTLVPAKQKQRESDEVEDKQEVFFCCLSPAPGKNNGTTITVPADHILGYYPLIRAA